MKEDPQTNNEKRQASPGKRRSSNKNELSIDEQIQALQPDEGIFHFLFSFFLLLLIRQKEIDGVWYVDGNRTLVSLNLRVNKITDTGAAAIVHFISVNPVITRCVMECNPISDGILTLFFISFLPSLFDGK